MHGVVADELAVQERRVDSLDTKAGLLLGLSGVVATLTGSIGSGFAMTALVVAATAAITAAGLVLTATTLLSLAIVFGMVAGVWILPGGEVTDDRTAEHTKHARHAASAGRRGSPSVGP